MIKNLAKRHKKQSLKKGEKPIFRHKNDESSDILTFFKQQKHEFQCIDPDMAETPRKFVAFWTPVNDDNRVVSIKKKPTKI